MQENFGRIFAWCLVHEGGYVNHPKDPGGETNKGVTRRVYDAYRARRDLPLQSVKFITDAEVAEIYERQYWDRVRGDDLPSGVDYAVYDFAVNSGVSRSVKFVQRLVGVAEDGVMGEVTLAAVLKRDPAELVQALCVARMKFLKRLKHWSTFGRGWTRRVMGEVNGTQVDDIGVIDRGWALAQGAVGIPAPVSKPDGAGAKGVGKEKVRSTLRDALLKPEVIIPALGPTGVLAAVKDMQGPIAYAIGGAIGVGVVVAAVMLLRRERSN